MNAAVILREISRSGKTLGDLFTAACQQLQVCTDTVAIAFLPFQFHRQPVIRVLRYVMQQSGGRAQVHDEGIDLAVIVVVGEAGAARDGLDIEYRSGSARYVGELAVSQAAKQRLLLRH